MCVCVCAVVIVDVDCRFGRFSPKPRAEDKQSLKTDKRMYGTYRMYNKYMCTDAVLLLRNKVHILDYT